jgi:hypothetical protein
MTLTQNVEKKAKKAGFVAVGANQNDDTDIQYHS